MKMVKVAGIVIGAILVVAGTLGVLAAVWNGKHGPSFWIGITFSTLISFGSALISMALFTA
jgi:uncharacterized membrane protein HdeD (DUF308 family)